MSTQIYIYIYINIYKYIYIYIYILYIYIYTYICCEYTHIKNTKTKNVMIKNKECIEIMVTIVIVYIKKYKINNEKVKEESSIYNCLQWRTWL